MLSSTSQLFNQFNQCQLNNPPSLMCPIIEPPQNELTLQLKYKKGGYFFNQLQSALSNSTIQEAFGRAMYNHHFSMQKKINFGYRSDNEIYTDSSYLRTIKTSEGHYAAVITWTQKGATSLNTGWRTFHGRTYQMQTSLNDYLFLSHQEIIYIPTPAQTDIETLRYYEGMQGLYGITSYRQTMDSDLVRAIADQPEVVRLIGEYCDSRLAAEGHRISMRMGCDRFVLTDSVPHCHVEDYHIFQRQYWLSGMFSRGVSYSPQRSLPIEAGRLLDPGYCPEYERRSSQP